MKKRSLLTLLEGSWETGFPAILQISSDRIQTEIEIQVTGKLPPAPDLGLSLQHWQSAYRQMVMSQTRIKAKPRQITNISYSEIGSELKYLLNLWLNQGTPEWQKIRDCLQRNLHHSDEIEIVIQTQDKNLQQLPWHLWDFFDHYSHAEIAFSTSEYQKANQLAPAKTKNKVKILAILGDRRGIDLEQDRAYLEQLSPEAEIRFLVEPEPEELNDQLWETGWDILFFAGHSSSRNQGEICLNPNDVLTLEQLKYALKKAINNGLCLAIFNSCDGLDLARELADLQLGQIIVMRELVPDIVAHIFLRYFLSAFSQGASLYNAVRIARERLQKLETKYPYATWLPVIFQNSAVIAPSWQDLTKFAKNHQYEVIKKLLAAISLPASAIATAFFFGMRELDIWHLIKLQALNPDNSTDTNEDDTPKTLISDIDQNIITSSSTNDDKGEIIFNEEQTSNLVINRIPDINGDSIDEIMIDLSSDHQETTYVVFGEANGFDYKLNLDNLDGNNGFVVNGIDWDKTSNLVINRLPDINGDSIDEILIDVLSSASNGKRKTYFVFGKDNTFDSKLDLDHLDGNNGFVVNGIDWDSTSKISVSRVKDINRDGIDEIAINVSKTNDGKRKIYIIYGKEKNFELEPNTPESDAKTLMASDKNKDDKFIEIFPNNNQQNSNINSEEIKVSTDIDETEETEIGLTNQTNNFDSKSEQDTLDILDINDNSVVSTIERNNTQENSDQQIPDVNNYDTTSSTDNNETEETSAQNSFPPEIDLEEFDRDDGIEIEINIPNNDGQIIIPDLFKDTSFTQLLTSNIGISPDNFDNIFISINKITINKIDDLLIASAEDDVIYGLGGDDTIEGLGSDDIIYGGLGDDFIIAGQGNDIVQGQQGNDRILGNEGDDTLIGGSGNDRINGHNGDDILIGGKGNDILIGGEGEDIFVFDSDNVFNSFDLGVDRILDFSVGEDKILLSPSTFTALDSTNADLAIVSNNSLASISNGEIVYNRNNGNLYYNPNGSADGFGAGGLFARLIDPLDNLSAKDFLIVDVQTSTVENNPSI